MAKVKWYVASFQYPESGEMATSKLVRSFGLGKEMVATLPESSSAMSVIAWEHHHGSMNE
jgi:hypothetical protein